MTKEQKQFIDGLTLQELQILESILKEDFGCISDYIGRILVQTDLSYDVLELTKSVPFSYLPVIGIDFVYYRFKTVYDYHRMNVLQKSQIRSMGAMKIEKLDYATDFLIECLRSRVQLGHVNSTSVSDGALLLDFDLLEKEALVLDQIKDIYRYLKEEGDSYVFGVGKKSLSADHLSTNANQRRLIEILARFSEIDDLKANRIESFQKFIRK